MTREKWSGVRLGLTRSMLSVARVRDDRILQLALQCAIKPNAMERFIRNIAYFLKVVGER